MFRTCGKERTAQFLSTTATPATCNTRQKISTSNQSKPRAVQTTQKEVMPMPADEIVKSLTALIHGES